MGSSPGGSARLIVVHITPAAGRVCASCMREIDGSGDLPTFGDREGRVYCDACGPLVGRVIPGFDCQVCHDGCPCRPGSRGCAHFQCQAFAVGGIIPDDPPARYASCGGAPRRAVQVVEFSRALKFRIMSQLGPDARGAIERLQNEGGEAGPDDVATAAWRYSGGAGGR